MNLLLTLPSVTFSTEKHGRILGLDFEDPVAPVNHGPSPISREADVPANVGTTDLPVGIVSFPLDGEKLFDVQFFPNGDVVFFNWNWDLFIANEKAEGNWNSFLTYVRGMTYDVSEKPLGVQTIKFTLEKQPYSDFIVESSDKFSLEKYVKEQLWFHSSDSGWTQMKRFLEAHGFHRVEYEYGQIISFMDENVIRKIRSSERESENVDFVLELQPATTSLSSSSQQVIAPHDLEPANGSDIPPPLSSSEKHGGILEPDDKVPANQFPPPKALLPGNVVIDDKDVNIPKGNLTYPRNPRAEQLFDAEFFPNGDIVVSKLILSAFTRLGNPVGMWQGVVRNMFGDMRYSFKTNPSGVQTVYYHLAPDPRIERRWRKETRKIRLDGKVEEVEAYSWNCGWSGMNDFLVKNGFKRISAPDGNPIYYIDENNVLQMTRSSEKGSEGVDYVLVLKPEGRTFL